MSHQTGPAAPSPESWRLANAWFLLALGALGVSALLALVLVVARTPFLGLGGRFFRTALVLHVDMAVVVWFLAAAAGIWTLSCGRAGRLGWSAFSLAASAVGVLLLSPMLGAPPPVLANYVPILDSLFFQGALAVFVAAVAAVAASSLAGSITWRSMPLWRQAAAWSALLMLAAILVLVIDYMREPRGQLVVPLTFDDRVWGAGHVLQFVYGSLLLGVWSVLGERLLGNVPALRRAFPFLVALASLPALAGILVALRFDVGSTEHRDAFTELMRWASWPAIALAGLGFAVAGLARKGADAGSRFSSREMGLLLSVLLFLVGCLVGSVISGNATTLVPAHYHGTVGAVTLAFMLFSLNIAEGYQPSSIRRRTANRQPIVYGGGIVVLVIGLAWSGLHGVPRKAPHEEFSMEGAAYLLGMGLAGIGGFVALCAVIAFVWTVMREMRHVVPDAPHRGRRDVRLAAIGATVVAIIAGGLLLGSEGSGPGPGDGARAHVADKKRKEIDLRFQQGIVMLHARQYDHALTAFHRVIELAPQLPEAYVNAGFAMLGKGEFQAAADFFDEATTLRRDQINAYFGLALALDGLGNTRGAVEAMRTYLHRASPADPFRAKAEASIREWKAALASSRPEGDPAAKH